MVLCLQTDIVVQSHLRHVLWKSLVFVTTLAVLIAPLQAANSAKVTAWPRHLITGSVGMLKIDISGAAGSGTVLSPDSGAAFPNPAGS